MAALETLATLGGDGLCWLSLSLYCVHCCSPPPASPIPANHQMIWIIECKENSLSSLS